MRTNSLPDAIAGTNVREVDANGNLVQGGLFGGNVYKSTKWITKESPEGSTCKQWLDQVVVSQKAGGAKKGENLVTQPANVDLSSSTLSRHVTALVVDAEGQQIGSQVFNYSLVRDFVPNETPEQDPIATELWFSAAPIQQIIDNQPTQALKDDLTQKMNRCLLGEQGDAVPDANSGN